MACKIDDVIGCFLSFCTFLTVVNGFNMDLQAPITQRINDTAAFFGYSVAMHRVRGENMMIVGAPRFQTNIPGVTRGGALFRCPLTPLTNPDSCEELTDFNTLGTDFDEEGHRLTDRSDQWFGASVKSSGPDGHVLVCRPLYTWFVQPEGSSDPQREPIGGCFLANSDFTQIQVYEPCRTAMAREQSVFGITHCQAGISADINQDEILLGAPGSFFWQGQIWVSNTNLQSIRRTNEGPLSFDDSYRGYAVAFGDFTGDSRNEYAVGIPRAGDSVGIVSIFDTSLNAYLNLTGTQVGAYFGHTLAVADLNDDEHNDLVVSAPFYIDEGKTTDGWEVGRVKIFYNDGNGGFSDGTPILGYQVSSRFGTAMVALGDVNQDGFNDLAISAPYGGDNRQGAVYIFHGLGSRGLSLTPAQTLEPSNFGLDLATFGYSLSAGMDLDNNDYPDLVIGAYKSSTVVLVRSRPVVDVDVTLLSLTEAIDLQVTNHALDSGTNVTSFQLRLCMTYRGTNVPTPIEFRYDFALDYNRQTTSRRANFDMPGNDASSVTDTMSLQRDTENCIDFTAYARPFIMDKLSPIGVSLNFSLADDTPAPGNILPILDQSTTTSTTISVPIQRNCMNQTCVPNLSVQASTDMETFLVGASEMLSIDVTISNSGEDAYLSTLTVSVPEELQYVGFTRVQTDQIVTCNNMVQESGISCDVGNPFVSGTTLNIKMQFSSENLPGNRDSVPFNFRVSSVDREQSTADNDFNVSIPLTVTAELSCFGVSNPDKIIFSEREYLQTRVVQYEEDIGPELTHVFSLYNNGPSRVGQTEVTIPWPMRYNSRQGNYLLYAISAEMDTGLPCTISGGWNPEDLQPNENGTIPSVSDARRRRRRATATEVPPTSTPTTFSPMFSTTESPVKQQDIACSGSQGDHCADITCVVDSLGAGSNSARDNVVITVKSRVWTNTLTTNSLELSVFLQAYARVQTVPYQTQFTEDIEVMSNEVETSITPQFLIPQIEQSKVPLWVYLVSILCGCMILIILILVLWRVGFFERKKIPADEKELKKSAADIDGQGVENEALDAKE